MRIVGLALLAGAFAACVIDGARSIAADQLSFTPIGATLFWAFPNKVPQMEASIREIHPILVQALFLPTWAVLGVVGAGLFYVVRRRPPPIGYSNRSR